MTGSGVRWAFAIAIVAYVFQACALVVWLATKQSMEKPIPPWEIVLAAKWIPFYTGMAVFLIGGLVLGRLKPLDVALNLALLAAALFLAIDVAITIAAVPQAHPWDGTAYSFLAKVACAALGVWIAGGTVRRR